MGAAILLFVIMLVAFAGGFAVGYGERQKEEAREKAKQNALDVDRLVAAVSATHAKLLERLGRD